MVLHRGAMTLEAQAYPDAVHHPNFPSVALPANGVYTQATSYRFSIAGEKEGG